MEAEIKELKVQIQSLHLCIIGDGVQIGGAFFKCFDDVKSWMLAKFPTQRCGLFLDAVTLLDFFTCIGHVDAEKSFVAF